MLPREYNFNEDEKSRARKRYSRSKRDFFAHVAGNVCNESERRNVAAEDRGESHFQRITLHTRSRIVRTRSISFRSRPARSEKCITAARLWVTAKRTLIESRIINARLTRVTEQRQPSSREYRYIEYRYGNRIAV